MSNDTPARFSPPPLFVDPDAPILHHKASCHCKLIRFTVAGPALSTKDKPTRFNVNSCNCTFCARNGWLLVYPPRTNVTFEDGSDKEMAGYTRTGGFASQKFCPKCGTSLYLDLNGVLGDGDEDRLCMNVNTFEGVDIHALEKRYFDGKHVIPRPN